MVHIETGFDFLGIVERLPASLSLLVDLLRLRGPNTTLSVTARGPGCHRDARTEVARSDPWVQLTRAAVQLYSLYFP